VDILKLQNAGISKKRCHHAVLTPNSYLNCFFRAVEGAPPLGGVGRFARRVRVWHIVEKQDNGKQLIVLLFVFDLEVK